MNTDHRETSEAHSSPAQNAKSEEHMPDFHIKLHDFQFQYTHRVVNLSP